METKYLIIGNSAGGIAATEAIRELDETGTITIVSEEPYPAYSRILISKYLTKERDLKQTLLRPDDFYDANDITFLPGNKVTKLQLKSHTAELEDGRSIGYEKLLLALGGAPIVPKIRGSDKEGVFTYTKLDDVKAIDSYLDNAKKAIVIGGGLIGTSATEALTKRGIKVTIVELKNHVLSTILDEYASSIVEKTLKSAGVRVITGRTVTEIIGADKATGVILDNDNKMPCDLVLIAIGVSPRIELVSGTNIKFNRGITVNRHMETSLPGVYACGDVAEAHDFVHGQDRVIPIWPGAHIGGRIAGFNMANAAIEYSGSTNMNTLSYFGLNIASGGIVIPPDDSYDVLHKKSKNYYEKIVLQGDKIVGFVFAGNIEKSGIILCMMRDQTDVSNIKKWLISKDACDLVYLQWHMRLESSKCRPKMVGGTGVEPVTSAMSTQFSEGSAVLPGNDEGKLAII
ncbi:NAD(P)/FAD-dependent oxidoreductase [Chloroflexota bacterium]